MDIEAMGTETKSVCVVFNRRIEEKSSSRIREILSDLVNCGVNDIHLVVNSPGGDIREGIVII